MFCVYALDRRKRALVARRRPGPTLLQRQTMSDPQSQLVIPSESDICQSDLLQRLVEGLPPREAAAFETLMRGGSVVLAAARAGVGRTTIYKWLKPGHLFQQCMAQWKEDLVASSRTRFLTMAEGATDNIQDAINHGDVRTSLRVVEKMGILGPPAVGPSNAQLHAEKQRLDNQEQQRSIAAQEEVEKFLSGLNGENPTARTPSSTDQRNRADAQSPEAHNPEV